MDHLAFYHAGCEPRPGRSRLKILPRRLLRRILLPIFQRLTEILSSLCHRMDLFEHEAHSLRAQLDDLRRRHEDQAAKSAATIAFGWDYVAMVRRLAALEEHVDALMIARNSSEVSPRPGDSSVRFSVGTSLDADRARVG